MPHRRHSLSFALALAVIASAAAGCAVEDQEDSSGESDAALSTAKLTPADVSILLPLPKANADESLAATARGKGGDELVPATAFKIAGAPGQKVLNETFYFDHGGARIQTPEKERPILRLTAVRVDPCGRVAPTDPESRCVPEVRLVFQPVLANVAGKFEAADGAIHAFYRVTLGELQAFTRALFDARNEGRGQPALVLVERERHRHLRPRGQRVRERGSKDERAALLSGSPLGHGESLSVRSG